MTTLIWDHSEPIAAWVAARIPYVDDFGPCRAVGVVGAGKLLAGVVFHDYHPSEDFLHENDLAAGTMQISMAAESPLWARKSTIGQILQYPFEGLDCYRVWTATPIDNTMALRVNEHIGFTREAVCHSAFGRGRHGVLMRLLRPDYDKLFREVLDGQEPTKTAACA